MKTQQKTLHSLQLVVIRHYLLVTAEICQEFSNINYKYIYKYKSVQTTSITFKGEQQAY